MIVTCNETTRSINVPAMFVPIADSYFATIDKDGIIVLTTFYRANSMIIKNTRGTKIRLPVVLSPTFDAKYDFVTTITNKDTIQLVPINKQALTLPNLQDLNNKKVEYDPNRTDCVFCGLNDPFLDMIKLDGVNVCYNCIDRLVKARNEEQKKEQDIALEKLKGDILNERN